MSDAPSPAGESGPSSTGSDAWRANVQQSYRNNEVREIARVLAALEPNATTASKLRLAMQFEDAVFKSAESLADYKKKLTKRLKKVQKSYVPPTVEPAATAELALLALKREHGASIKFILQNASVAVTAMRNKAGDEKANQLQQFIESVKTWANDMGLMPNGKLNRSLTPDHVQMLRQQIEKRIESVRVHVLKLVNPDQFLLETVEKTENDLLEKTKMSKIVAMNTRKRYEQLQRATLVDPEQQRATLVDPEQLFKESLEATFKSIPLPSRHSQVQEQATMQIDKMRAASTLAAAFMMIPEKNALLPGKILSKTHTVVFDGSQVVMDVLKDQRKEDADKDSVLLEHAWMKPLVRTESDALEEATKPRGKPVVSTRVLLRPGRKTPTNLLVALKRKRAKLVRPPPSGHGTHLILDFDGAFVIYIYFVPLLVQFRARSDSVDNSSALKMSSFGDGLYAQNELSVWGATAAPDILAHVVEERLKDASAHATRTLRLCMECAVRDSATDFEMEIREATALLEFLQLVRNTYMPNWQDDED